MVSTINNIFLEEDLKQGNLFDRDENSLGLIINNWGCGMRTIAREIDSNDIKGTIYDIYSNRDMDIIEDRRTVSVYRNLGEMEYITPADDRYDKYKQKLMERKIW